MARSFSNVKLILALANNVSLGINRRCFAAVSNTRSESVMKAAGEASKKDSEISSWVPDPVTGYYRPANHADQIDAAELRQALLNNINKRHN